MVAAPFWDLSYSAALRTYIEYISANGLTYHYEADGCHGTAGRSSWCTSPPAATWSGRTAWAALYWRQLCAMFGIGRFDYVFGGGLT